MVANVRAEHEGDGETAPARMAPAVRLTVALDEAAVVAGGELALAATVHNTGDAPARCALDLSGAPAAWCVVDEPSVALGPGERRLLSVTVRPPVTVVPGAAGAGSSPWRLTLRATPDGDAPVPAVAHVALMVGAPAQLSLELAPAEAEGCEATFRATFVNPTAAPAALALLVDDGAEGATGLRVRVEPGGDGARPRRAGNGDGARGAAARRAVGAEDVRPDAARAGRGRARRHKPLPDAPRPLLVRPARRRRWREWRAAARG